MTIETAVSTPWHRESFDRFLQERLPQLLAERMPLASYLVEATGETTCRVRVLLAGPSGEVAVEYGDLPRPDADGLFAIDGTRRVVVPVVAHEHLGRAEVFCVGEQLYESIEARLGQAPAGLPWDEALARTWLPLDTWVRDFLRAFAHTLDDLNWLARRHHLRRIRVRERGEVITPGHLGRACPIETPEGPNIGRILLLSIGAVIRNQRIEIVDLRPEARLGLSASMIPFIEHSDVNRLLMGANMMRQWLAPPDPEPALVRTGNEPDAPDFWCGRNLLTAFVAWDADSFEDALVISESCARRLGYPRPIEPGDKLSNRHGAKGVVSRILPDDRMPHLPDGTPVEILYHFLGLPSRLNFGQVREALMGRIARAEGRPAIVPPFGAPDAAELRRRLAAAALPESGMETLTVGREGSPCPRPTLVGPVYWGRLHHLASEKLHACVTPGRCQRQGEEEYAALREVGAWELIREQLNTRAAEREDAGTLAARAAAGPVPQAPPPTPRFAAAARRLAAGGVRVELAGERLTLRLEPWVAADGTAPKPPAGGTDRLPLARPIPHPWIPERRLTAVGAAPEIAEYPELVRANARLARMQEDNAPRSLLEPAATELEARVADFFAALLPPESLRPAASVLFSGRAVLAPGPELPLDRIILPEEIAWSLFGPWVARELGDANAIASRTDATSAALDAVMERSWVILYRPGFRSALDVAPLPFLAFRPLREPSRVIRVPPLACNLMDADFDGDQIAALLPITEAGQREAAERLSIAGRLARDPGLLPALCPTQEPIWGLAALSLTTEGRAEIARLAGTEVAADSHSMTRRDLVNAMQRVLERDGVDAALAAIARLSARGWEAARASGASESPFLGDSVPRPPLPEGNDPDAWSAYLEALTDRLAARTDYDNPDIGPQLLAVKSGARGTLRQLCLHLGGRTVAGFAGEPVPVRHGYVEGLSPEELCAHAIGAWRGLDRIHRETATLSEELRRASEPKGFHVLARAMRAKRPGAVFARAAAAGEVDPLTDPDSRAFVGLPVAAG
jgi:hypothetical protein